MSGNRTVVPGGQALTSPPRTPMRHHRSTRAVALVAAMAILGACSGSPAPSPSTSTSGVPATPPPTPSQSLPAVPTTANPATGLVGPLRSPGGPFLFDRDGRAVLMHGVDLVYKVPPYEVEVNGTGPNVLTPRMPNTWRHSDSTWCDGDHLERPRAGHCIRSTTPPSAPGTPKASGAGQYNESVFDAYLNKLDATVALLAQYGIYSLIDMHQDVYNDVFGGEGAPDWAVCTDGVTPQPQSERPRLEREPPRPRRRRRL